MFNLINVQVWFLLVSGRRTERPAAPFLNSRSWRNSTRTSWRTVAMDASSGLSSWCWVWLWWLTASSVLWLRLFYHLQRRTCVCPTQRKACWVRPLPYVSGMFGCRFTTIWVLLSCCFCIDFQSFYLEIICFVGWNVWEELERESLGIYRDVYRIVRHISRCVTKLVPIHTPSGQGVVREFRCSLSVRHTHQESLLVVFTFLEENLLLLVS